MTKEEIERLVDENLDSIVIDDEGSGVIVATGQPATEADFTSVLHEHLRLKKLLRSAP